MATAPRCRLYCDFVPMFGPLVREPRFDPPRIRAGDHRSVSAGCSGRAGAWSPPPRGSRPDYLIVYRLGRSTQVEASRLAGHP